MQLSVRPGEPAANPNDAYERIFAALYKVALDPGRWPQASALIDGARGGAENRLVVGEGAEFGPR